MSIMPFAQRAATSPERHSTVTVIMPVLRSSATLRTFSMNSSTPSCSNGALRFFFQA